MRPLHVSRVLLAILPLTLLAAACVAPAGSPAGTLSEPAPSAATSPDDARPVYHVYVANESSDVVSRVAFSPGGGAHVVAEIPVGLMQTDPDAPHGLAVSPTGDAWYVSLAHGTPFGSVWKFRTGDDAPAGRVQLGRFPASMTVSRDGVYLFVSNFNLHGAPEPSGISVVYTPGMVEVARPTTCVMPHGGRLSASGAKHYSTCMHSDQLVELDVASFEVTARFSVAPGAEGPLPLDDTGAHAAHGAGAAGQPGCSPTWATPARGDGADRLVYVTCNRSGAVLEVDVVEGRVRSRFELGSGPYNMEVTPDGRRLLVTLKGGQALSVVDLESGREAARIATSRPVTHGVVVTTDGRYAFVSNEAVGSTRGTVDVVDLARLERVATAELRYQPGGLDLAPSP